MKPQISIVLPVLNERENMEPLLRRLLPVLEPASGGSFEIIWVNDGSTDDSAAMLERLHAQDARCKVIHLSRNFGHQAAFEAGLEFASGEAVVLMDADLQDPPEVLTTFIAQWRAGHHVVYGVRRHRQERWLKRAAYHVFYRTLRAIAQIDVPLDAGDFCLLDRRVVDTLTSLPEHHRFLRGLRSWVGFRQVGVPYERPARFAGAPKYTFRKLVALAVSGYIGFSAMPLRLASWLGMALAAAGFGLLLWVVGHPLFGRPAPWGWISSTAVTLLLGGINLLVLGVVGEYLSRVYDEVRRRPLYVVRAHVGFNRDEARHR